MMCLEFKKLKIAKLEILFLAQLIQTSYENVMAKIVSRVQQFLIIIFSIFISQISSKLSENV
jgi:hypothetical protein